eukprot:CAMPEP_0183809774 /NCGR_PEP_ID=MMETSP0803_2-20130417/46086_1 /TAXON_ID=195967 /ORGANISM="Crustomastix stigmata, Strain CCMP3273" /LENGTH=150 /DNA_ID=CAMNT_0026054581 /DNA_START=151 /DNA_END=600 /DNA_ORIENTATION=+
MSAGAAATALVGAMRRISKRGLAVLEPQKMPWGTWHKAEVSPRIWANNRKRALAAGQEWPWEKPEPEKPMRKPNKGHKRDRLSVASKAKIAAALELMPKKFEEWREAKKKKKEKLLGSGADRFVWNTKERRQRARNQGAKGEGGSAAAAR